MKQSAKNKQVKGKRHTDTQTEENRKQTEKQTDEQRETDIFGLFTQPEITLLHLFFSNYICKIGQKLKLKQRVIATACVFFKRFYLDGSFVTHDPRTVAVTVLFLACKSEECRVNADDMVSAVSAVACSLGDGWVISMAELMASEFEVLEHLNFNLVVFHPYRLLTQYLLDVNLCQSLQTAWEIVNDSYRTDLCLRYPPQLISVSAVYMVCGLFDISCRTWLHKLGVDMNDVYAITQTILSLYTLPNGEGVGVPTLGDIFSLLGRLDKVRLDMVVG